jgi:hypothetical protein
MPNRDMDDMPEERTPGSRENIRGVGEGQDDDDFEDTDDLDEEDEEDIER